MKKLLIYALSGVLAIGALTGFGYAYTKDSESTASSKLNMERKLWDRNSDIQASSQNDTYQDIVQLMNENGMVEAAKYMQAGDYEAMDEYMNNMTEQDYDQMIKIMNENGYEGMGRMMESIGQEGMIQMHNSMGGAQGMMGGY